MLAPIRSCACYHTHIGSDERDGEPELMTLQPVRRNGRHVLE
jgi:hypothetical protein